MTKAVHVRPECVIPLGIKQWTVVAQKAVPVVLQGALQKILPRNFAQTFSCSEVVMTATAQTEIFDL